MDIIMKKRITLRLLFSLLLSFLILTLSACGGTGGGTTPQKPGEKQVPVYTGMTVSTEAPLAATGMGAGQDNGNHNGHFKGDHSGKEENVDKENPYPDNDENENIEEEIETSLEVIGSSDTLYYAKQNGDIYIHIHLSNPDNFEILSFTLNGQKFSDYMFENGSNMQTIILKYNVGNASGITEYTIDAIKYIDGTDIKDVLINGNKTVSVGIAAKDQVTASVTDLKIKESEISFAVDVQDRDGLIAASKGALKAVLYNGDAIVAEKDITLGQNSVLFGDLKIGALYQLAIVGFYDGFTGDGFGANLLYKDAFYTKSVILFDAIEIGEQDIFFDYLRTEGAASAVTALKLYRGDTLIASPNASEKQIKGLLSDTTYKLVAEYTYAGKNEYIYLEFTTLQYASPDFEIKNPTQTQTTVGFTVTETDADDLGAVSAIELICADGTVNAVSPEQRSFEGLQSGTTYTLKVTYTYDLRDGKGERALTKQIQITTDTFTAPSIAFAGVVTGSTGITFAITEIDLDQVGAIERIELLMDGEVVDTITDASIRSFSGLRSETEYTVRITYVYDLHDGNGAVTLTESIRARTVENGVPYILISGGTQTQTSVGFAIEESDPVGLGNITKIELFKGDEFIRAAVSGETREFAGLLSNTEYTVKVTYVYNLLDGAGDKTEVKEIKIKTFSMAKPSVIFESTESTKNTVSFSYNAVDINNVGRVLRIELLKGDTVVKSSENADCTEFTDLLSNTRYTVRITYAYDLNDGSGAQTITREVTVATKRTAAPKVTVESAECAADTLHITLDKRDPDETVKEILVSLLLGEEVIEAKTVTDTAVFEDLLYNELYTVLVTVTYDLCDGNGERYDSFEQLVLTPLYTDEDGYSYVFYDDGTAEIAGYVGEEKFLELPSEINGYTVTGISEGAFLAAEILSVTIPDTVTVIGDGAFYLCYILSDIYFDSVESIGAYAFSECHSLESIELPDSVSYIGEGAFATSGLTRVHFGSGIDSLGYDGGVDPTAFYGCYLEEVFIPKSVEKIYAPIFNPMGYYDPDHRMTVYYGGVGADYTDVAFAGLAESCFENAYVYCYCVNEPSDSFGRYWHYDAYGEIVTWPRYSAGLKYTYYSNGTCAVSGIGSCTDTDVMIPPAAPNGYTVTTIAAAAFRDLETLYSVTLPDTVTSIKNVPFKNCQNLTSVNLGNGVTIIGNSAFEYCSSLQQIIIPSSVTYIDDYAFNGCSSLSRVLFTSRITTVGTHAFHDCTDLVEVYYEGSASEWEKMTVKDVNDYLLNAPRYFYSEQAPTESGRFWYYDAFGEIAVWEATSEGDQGLTFASNGDGTCSVIGIGDRLASEVEIPELSPSGDRVTSIEAWAFKECILLSSITIPESVTSIGWNAFSGCISLESITIPASVTYIEENAFSKCYFLAEFTVLDGNENYSSIDGNLYSADGARLIKYAAGKIDRSFAIPDGVEEIGLFAFEGMPSLEHLVISDSVIAMPMDCFSECYALTTVVIGSSVSEIAHTAFRGCASLTTVIIKEGVTDIQTYAFADCTSLTSIVIPASVTLVENRAFDGCTALEVIYYGGTASQWSAMNKTVYNTALTAATRYYYSASRPAANEESYWHYDAYGEPELWSDASDTPTDEPLDPSYSQGLVYTSNGDGTCSVTEIGTCRDRDIVIPSVSPSGDKVIAIDASAFFWCEITSVTVPDSVTTIGEGAFSMCCELTEINLGNGVTAIGDGAFSGCPITSIVIPDSVTYLGACAFESTALESIVLGSGVTAIHSLTFYNCTELVSVTIPVSVTRIDPCAFAECTALAHIDYEGSAADFDLIEIDEEGLYCWCEYYEALWEDILAILVCKITP